MSLSVRERGEGFLALAVAVAPSLQCERAEGVLTSTVVWLESIASESGAFFHSPNHRSIYDTHI